MGTSGYKLVVAEKPSVARDIARVLGVRGRGDGCLGTGRVRITWCVGHLVELMEPHGYRSEWKAWRLDALPMIPDAFRLQPRTGGGADQWQHVRRLMTGEDLLEVVNACDAGREGELIFAYAYEHAGCRAPVRRLWISSMTDEAIRGGFARLQPGSDFRRLEDAARCRSEADWLVGLNATRAMTLRMRRDGDGPLLSLGRVQTPTLALLDEREGEIERFVPEDFWQVRLRFEVPAGFWVATWTEPGPDGKPVDRLADRERAEAILARVTGQPGTVRHVDRKQTRERPPLLYDLTTLQKECNRRYGFSAARTLEIAQALYEKHKVITYPRTDARHIGSDQIPELPRLVGALSFPPYSAAAEAIQAAWPPDLGTRVVDDAEISDHHAILPTGRDPRSVGLSADEKRVFDRVARRFLAALTPDAVFAAARIVTDVGEDRFLARGRTCLEPGWRAIDPPQTQKKETLLPPVVAGDVAENRAGTEVLHSGQTKPPLRYTEATLLGAMESAGERLDDAELKRAMKRNGLGTPATRAAIIETLLARGYARRADGAVVPTDQGRALLKALPVEALRSARLTGEWEARLGAIAEGAEERARFMADVRELAARAVETIRVAEVDPGLVSAPADGELLGVCPSCQGEVRAARWGWRCVACPLRIPDRVANRTVSPRMARQLLANGVTETVKGFRSKKGKPFTAALALDSAGKVVFRFEPSPSPSPSPSPAPDAAPPVGPADPSPPAAPCPRCRAPVRLRAGGWRCDGCDLQIPASIARRPLRPEDVAALLTDGRTQPLHGFQQAAGARFKASLVLSASGKVTFEYGGGGPEHPAHCPVCIDRGEIEPGHVIAGHAAWGCSRWRDGCGLRVPFEIDGVRLPEEEAKRLFGKYRATRYLKGFEGRRTTRVVLRPGATPCWALEERRGRPKEGA